MCWLRTTAGRDGPHPPAEEDRPDTCAATAGRVATRQTAAHAPASPLRVRIVNLPRIVSVRSFLPQG
jgi:hypothetical protein